MDYRQSSIRRHRRSPSGGLRASLFALLFPADCPVCGATIRPDEEVCCDACTNRMPPITRALCLQCRAFRTFDDSACPRNHELCLPAATVTLGTFDDAWRAVVHALKYQGRRSLAAPLGQRLAGVVAGSGIELVVPVPTDPEKRRSRGFGHAELIARCVAEGLSLPCAETGLRLTRRVSDQTHLPGAARLENLKNAFAVSEFLPVTGKRVLVVDDVTTTGATLKEAARMLNAAGAASVLGAVLCINLGDHAGNTLSP